MKLKGSDGGLEQQLSLAIGAVWNRFFNSMLCDKAYQQNPIISGDRTILT